MRVGHNRNRSENRNRNRRSLAIPKNPKVRIAGIALVVIFIFGIMLAIHKYAPTKEKMSLTDYFVQTEENESSVILNGEYYEVPEATNVYALVQNGTTYLSLGFIKANLDDGYVYDDTENILRYTTDTDVISVNLGESSYTVNKDTASMDQPIIIYENDMAYLSVDFVKLYTDITYYTVENPNRIVVETAGWEKTVATVKRDTELRRFGGNKSKILATVSKGDSVIVMENYGKWSLVLSEDGVLGCIKNSKLRDKTKEETEATLEKREYSHISMDETINMAWFQVTNSSANSGLSEYLANTNGLNVLSPTWFYLSDNAGGVGDYGSLEAVTLCHQQGIQVWGLLSNLVVDEVDTTAVLNTTSARDNLINNILAKAIAYDLDGINIDLETISANAADGYVEFIRELSLKCEKNDLILSVDNYVPSASSAYYNRSAQADYADYCVIMAYDEHYSGSEEAGSVSSIDFVKNGVKDTLEEVPADQIILALPFYTRLWKTTGDSVTSTSMGMQEASEYLIKNDIETTWDDETGQYYAEFEQDGSTYSIWMEDNKSLDLKLQVFEDNKLAGVSFWKLGFEPSSIWDTIAKYTN